MIRSAAILLVLSQLCGESLLALTFASPIVVGTGSGPTEVVFADLDGDGRKDLAVAMYNLGQVKIWRNTSAPGVISFDAPVALAAGGGCEGVAVGDLNADGLLDVAAACAGSSTVAIFPNTSTPGVLSFGTRTNLAVNTAHDVALADLDRDNRPDLIATSNSGRQLRYFRNVTLGSSIAFVADGTSATATFPDRLGLADLDHDGRLDAIAQLYNSGALAVFRNTSIPGDVAFASAASFGASASPAETGSADLNGDGRLDLVAGAYVNAGIAVLGNTSAPGALSFSPAMVFAPGGSGPHAIDLVDIDADGDIDAITADDGSNSLTIWSNQTSGAIVSFDALQSLTVGGAPFDVVAGDVDSDGAVDLTVSNNAGNSLFVFRNTTAGAIPEWVALGDSFSAGEGAGAPNYLAGTDSPAENMCHRANSAYARTRVHLPWTAQSFFACSGARSSNVLLTSQGGRPQCAQTDSGCVPYSAPDSVPQLEHQQELAAADLVTMTNGGNDMGFVRLLKLCYSVENCEDYVPPGWTDSLGQDTLKVISVLKPRFRQVIETVRVEAPNADVRVMGYPALFPSATAQQSCDVLTDPLGIGWWSPSEQAWLNSLVPILNAAVREAAEAAGARFVRVDLPGFFPGHEICGSEGTWFVPPPNLATVITDFGVPPESFHPTADGHRAGYRSALEADLAAVPLGSQHPRIVPAGATERLAAEEAATLGDLRLKIVDAVCGEAAIAGQTLSVSGDEFLPGTTVTIRLNAPDPRDLGTAVVEPSEEFFATVSIPADVAPQFLARLDASGVGVNSLPRLLMGYVTIGADLSVDQDGDGIPDTCDNCAATANAGQGDLDLDGAGDSCDSCSADPLNDADGDGLCADADLCAADPLNDIDGDGFCGDWDNCPLVPNETQADADGDSWGDACDACGGESDVLCPFADGFETGTVGRWSDAASN